MTLSLTPPCAQLASGEVFGPDQPIALQLLGSERSAEAIEGVAMELEDSLYPLLREVGAFSFHLGWGAGRVFFFFFFLGGGGGGGPGV